MVRDRTFLACFAISLFVHLTMVTFFSIELRYEQKPIRYYPFDIIDVRQIAPFSLERLAQLNLPLDMQPSAPAGDTSNYFASLPEISLPTLNFDQISAQVRSDVSLEATRLNAPFANPQSMDAWARFGEEIQDVRDALRSLPPFDLLPLPESQRERAASDTQAEGFHPAPGLLGRVEWMAEPRDRKLLYAPPAPPQWSNASPGLNHAVSVMFQVTPDGAVVQVIAPIEERSEVVDGVVSALKDYRFEPQPGSGNQPASLVLEPEEGTP